MKQLVKGGQGLHFETLFQEAMIVLLKQEQDPQGEVFNS